MPRKPKRTIRGEYFYGYDLPEYRPDAKIRLGHLPWLTQIYADENEYQWYNEEYVADVEDAIKNLCREQNRVPDISKFYDDKLALLLQLIVRDELKRNQGVCEFGDVVRAIREEMPFLRAPVRVMEMELREQEAEYEMALAADAIEQAEIAEAVAEYESTGTDDDVPF